MPEYLDLFGLGDNRIARAKRDGENISAIMAARMKQEKTDYVICYPIWFQQPDKQLPDDLILVESWVLEENLVCGSPNVGFYATSPEASVKLAAALAQYRSETPPSLQSTNRMYPKLEPKF